MQLILVDRYNAKVGIMPVRGNDRSAIYCSLKVKPSIASNKGNNDKDEFFINISSEMTEGKKCILVVFLSPLEDGNYELLVRSSKSGPNVLKYLQERFQDSVVISVEMYTTTPDADSDGEDSDESDEGGDMRFCVSSKRMQIDEKQNNCKAHSRYMSKFDLKGLNNGSSLRIKVIAHIDDDLIIPNAYLMKKTNKMIFEDGVASDVIITAGNGAEIKSHKCFLVPRSSVLQRMLDCGMEESKNGRIDMTDISEKGVRAFLRYLYLGEVVEGSMNLMYNLLYAAHKYDVPGLEARMKEDLLEIDDEDFSVKYAFKIYSFVRGIESFSELKDKFLNIMHLKFDDLKETSEFKEVFQKNTADAIEICDNLVRIKSSPRRRKLDSEEHNNEAGKKSRDAKIGAQEQES